MKEAKISYIVAAYNIEKYIDRCIKSLLNQTMDEIEIIIVDDASTDETGVISNRYSEQHKDKIIYIKKGENEGLSEARNTGLRCATGKYVIFVDGDDYIEESSAEKLINVAERDGAEVIIFANQYDLINGNTIYRLFRDGKTYFENENIMKELFPRVIGTLPEDKSDYDVGFAPWARMIKRELLINNCVFFTSERKLIYEDLIFTLELFPFLSKVSLLNIPLYHYCENQQSLTKTGSDNKIARISKMYFSIDQNEKYKRLFEDNGIKMRYRRTIISYIRLCLLQTSSTSQIQNIINDPMTIDVLSQYPINKLPIKQRILTLCVKLKFVYGVKLLLMIYKGVKK